MQGLVQLSWDNFSEERSKALHNLFQAGLLTDVTLVCEDVSLAAHAVVLAAASPLLSQILCSATSTRPALLFLRGASQSQLKALLQFVYTGECAVSLEELQKFMLLAQDLRISGLEDNMKELEKLQPKSLKSEKIEGGSSTEKENRNNKNKIEMGELSQNSEENSCKATKHMLDEIPEGGIDANRGTEGSYLLDQTLKSLMTSDGLQCTECDYKSIFTGHLKEHVEIHTSGFYLQCSSCQRWASSKGKLRRHRKKDVANGAVLVYKDIPKDGIDGTAGLQRYEAHLKSLMVTTTEGVQCTECPYISSSGRNVQEHVETHTSGYYFQCPHCSYWVQSKARHRQHRLACSKLKSKKKYLGYCNI